MSLDLFGDFGFVGGFNTPANPYQDSQVCINFYPEISASQHSKEQVTLLGCPGLEAIVSTGALPTLGTSWAQPSSVTDQPVRGLWTLTGQDQAVAVIGNAAYLVTPSVEGATSVQLYQTLLASPDLTTANQLSTVTGPGLGTGVPLTGSSTGYGEIPSQGSAAAWPAGGSLPSPSGDGFLWDSTVMEGNSIVAQTFNPYLVLRTSPTGGDLYADAYFRIYKYNASGPTYTLIAACKNSGLHFQGGINVIASTGWTNNTLASTVNFSTGDKIYMDVILDITSNTVMGSPFLTYATGFASNVIVQTGSELILPILSISQIGTLNTATGPVSIRDSGIGGLVCMVDGPYGYYYVFGAGGSDVGGIGTFTRILDPNFLGANTVAFIDGWFIFNQPGTQKFYTTAQPYSGAFDASYYAYKDAFSDELIGVFESKEELWLVGAQTTEIWYDSGGQYFPFTRLVGTLIQVGCTAPNSIARYSVGGQDGIIFLGRSDRGQAVVLRTVGFSAQVVSTPAISDQIAKLYTQSDAIGYTVEMDGHEFYVLTFPSEDVTWVYDGTLPPEYAWHQRLSYDPYAQQFHRHRSNCYMLFQGYNIVGDYQNGTLYNYTRDAFSDAAWPILARRRSPFIWDESRTRVFMNSLQIEFSPGVGNASGTWTNPQAYLSISRDYGTTYGQPLGAPIGMQGNFVNRCMWRRLGMSRGAVAQIDIIDPVKRDIVGATLRAASEPRP